MMQFNVPGEHTPLREKWRYKVEDLFQKKQHTNGRKDPYSANTGELSNWDINEKRAFDKRFVMQEIGNDGYSVQLIGVEDGMLGQSPKAMTEILRTRTLQWQAFLYSSYKTKFDAIVSKSQELEKEHQEASVHLQEKQEYVNLMEKKYRWNYRKFGLVEGFIYLFFALILVAADYPLSLSIVNEGFGISNEFKIGSLKVGMLLALGMVLTTVFFKFFYDDYLGKPVSKMVARFKRRNLFGLEDFNDDDDIRKAKSIYNMRFYTHVFVMLMLILTLIFIGFFRHEVMAGMDDVNNTYYQSWWALLSYIFLSVLMPLIGGVCASRGITRIKNQKEFKRARKALKKATKHRDDLLKKKLECMMDEGQIKELLEWCKSDGNFVEETSNYFIARYKHGYCKGLSQNTATDLYEFTKSIRSKVLASQSHFYFENMAWNPQFQNKLNQN